MLKRYAFRISSGGGRFTDLLFEDLPCDVTARQEAAKVAQDLATDASTVGAQVELLTGDLQPKAVFTVVAPGKVYSS